MLWKSAVRPRLRNAYGRARPFLWAWTVFTLAFIGGGELASWTFLKLLSLLIWPMINVPAGLFLTTIFWMITRRAHAARPLARGAALTVFGVFIALIVLHFTRYSPRRFGFLGDHPLAFSVPPGFVPTYTEAVYTFRADPLKVMEEAHVELASQGYQIRMSRDEWWADRSYQVMYSGSEWPVPDAVTIRPGRATKPQFHFDAYDVHIEPDPGWVTIEVDQPELLPFWLRVFVP